MSRHPRPVAINVSEDANNMRELGRVIETAGNMAKVEIFRRDECTRCKVCGFGSRDRIIAVATNTVGAKEHDEVELELEAASGSQGSGDCLHNTPLSSSCSVFI